MALTRGRGRNTAYVVTTAVPDDAPTGQAHEVAPSTARAVLAGIIESDQASNERSSLGTAEHAEAEARSVQAPLDRLAAESAELTAGRTGAILDRLAAQGAITDAQREALAADEAYASLEQVLRTAEVCGRDPRTVLASAIADQTLDGARWPARVLHSRISRELRHDSAAPISGFADLIPRTVTEQQRARLDVLAERAEDRRRELGADTAQQGPQWAIEALGPVPDDAIARAEWEQAAGWAAVHRESAGHDDATDPLGTRPPAGLAEQRATWAAAHVALNLPDGGSDEHDLTDGQLRVRVRALEREEAWAPRWVGDELAATHQSAQQARTDAQVWAARAEVADNDAERAQLRADAEAAEQRAAEHAERAAELELADEARGQWYAETAVTRDAAWCARGALQSRGIDLDDPDEQTTAVEWLAADRAAQAAEDPHREITHDAELIEADHNDDHDDDAAAVAAEAEAGPVATNVPAADDSNDRAAEPGAETAVPDIRAISGVDVTEHADPAQRHRVPTVAETAADVARAQAALAEIEARREADAAREAEHAAQHQAARREELTQWAEQDRADESAQPATDDADDDDAKVLER